MSLIPIKSPAEIEKMRAAGRVAALVLDRLAKLVAPGVTTGEIDRAAGEYMAELGGKSAFLGYRKFPGQICISVNEEVVHCKNRHRSDPEWLHRGHGDDRAVRCCGSGNRTTLHGNQENLGGGNSVRRGRAQTW